MIEVKVDVRAADVAIDATSREIEQALSAAVDRLLQSVAGSQILAYTANSNPAPPPDSSYERTMTLQGASKEERTGPLSGIWSADEEIADYAEYVIGRQADQAVIHQGRWKSLEEVEAEINQAADDIIKETLREQGL